MAKQKIVYLSADMGNGHNSTVQALMEAVETHYPGKYDQEVIDVVALIGPTLDKIAAKIYEKTVMISKTTYKVFFEFSDKSEITNLFDKIGYPLVKPSLKPIADAKPDLIVSCFPFLTYSVSRYIKQKHMHIPFVSIITDTGEVHSSWVSDRIDCYFVQTPETGFYLAETGGIKKEKIKCLGFAVKQAFYQTHDKNHMREKNGLPKDKKIILYFNGAWGSGKLKAKLDELDSRLRDVVIIPVCGKNEKLMKEISKLRYRNKIIPLGFVNNISEYMAASDLIISKAGGISIMEIVTMKKPVVVTEVVPGQEEPNARFIESMGFGYVEKDPEDLARRVKYMLESDDLHRIQQNYSHYHLNENADERIADAFVAMMKKDNFLDKIGNILKF